LDETQVNYLWGRYYEGFSSLPSHDEIDFDSQDDPLLIRVAETSETSLHGYEFDSGDDDMLRGVVEAAEASEVGYEFDSGDDEMLKGVAEGAEATFSSLHSYDFESDFKM
jgi:hypothetical protein